MTDAYVHVYGQDGPHDPVIVVGTREGLLRVLDALLEALLATSRQPRLVFCADGEGYEIDVHMVSEADLRAHVSPYGADWARDTAEDMSPRWPLKE